MATRWEVTKAVRRSALPPPSRLIMLTLADVAEVGTAEIPARFTPSLTVLANETGLDRSTVRRHLTALEEAGWVQRHRPDPKAQWDGERTCYRLMLPPGADLPTAEAPLNGRGDKPPGERQVSPTLGAQDTQVGAEDTPDEAQCPYPGGSLPPGVGAESPQGRGTVPLLYRSFSDQDLSDLKEQPQDPAASPPDLPPEAAGVAVPDRPDVDQLCRHLADRIEENGSKRPTVTKAWRDAARLLLDKDGRTPAQVMRAIDWCQNDEFWRGNILSMPKLRLQYDRLRLAAQRANGSNGHRPSTTDQRVAAALALAARYDAMEAP